MENNEKPPTDVADTAQQPPPYSFYPSPGTSVLPTALPPVQAPQVLTAPAPVLAPAPVPSVLSIPAGATISPPQVAGGGPPIIIVRRFESKPMIVTCTSCGATGMSTTENVKGTFTWVSVLILIFIGCFIGCCLFPLCIDACKDVEHHCSQCKACVGVYRRM